MSVDTGGMVITRPAARLSFPTSFTLMSDLHIGAANVDYKAIERELATAKENGDRILLNGDVFDMITVKDAKRFVPDVIHPRLRGRRDLVNASVEWGTEILGPYADHVDMIGVGNHEVALEHYGSYDPTSALIYQLSLKLPEKSPHKIHYGGYTGFLDYRIGQDTNAQRFVIWYHHGMGGGAPVTKGMIDLHRTGWVDANVIWLGHKHVRVTSHIQTMHCPLKGKQPILKDVRQIITGAYFQTYKSQSQEQIKKHGRRSNYAADRGLQPQGCGGVRLLLTAKREGGHRGFDVKIIH